VARAARVVAASGPPEARAAGRLLLQTRLPDHEVVQAAVRADVAPVAAAEQARRSILRFPPETAMAEVSGPAAAAFIDHLGAPLGVEVVAAGEGRWWLRAPDHQVLCDALSATPRPTGRLRIEVDPLRV
jgi:primosomal protein N' (replication factor Y)